jgi:uncharacterized protein YfdQ (DUF2303 family)
MKDVLAELDRRRANPVRRSGTTSHDELMSFIDHVNRNKVESRTTIWADTSNTTFTAIYNDHDTGGSEDKAGWRDHRAVYTCPLSPEWIQWNDKADEWLTQEDFAQWLEERMEDLAAGIDNLCPAPVELLEMARNLQIYTEGTFQKKIDPATGQYSMVCKEEHRSDSTKIYRNFAAGLRIFDGGEKYRVEMRIKFNLKNGRPYFMFTVHRSSELVADAFGEMRETIYANTELPVFAGRA